MPEAPLGLPLLQLQHGAPRGAGSEQRDCSWGRDVPAARCSEGGARDHAARVKPCMRLSVPLPGRGHLYGEENKYELSLPPPALHRPRGIHAPRPPSRWRCLSLTARSLAFISARTDLFIQRRFAWSFSIVNLQPCERQRPRWSPSSRAVLFSLVAQDPCSGDVGGLCSPGSSPRVRRASVTLRDFPVACRPPSWGSRRPRRVLYFYSLCSATFTVTRLWAPPSAPSHGPMRTASSPPEHGRARLLCRRPPPPRPPPPGIRPVAESPSLAARPHPQGPRKSRVAPQGLHGTGLLPPPGGARSGSRPRCHRQPRGPRALRGSWRVTSPRFNCAPSLTVRLDR